MAWILEPGLSRRELVRAAAACAVTGLAGCRTAQLGLTKDELPAGLTWLTGVDPLQPAKFPQTDFTGDSPTFSHKHLRDARVPPLGAPTESAGVVIIGGGLSGLAAAYLLRAHQPVLLEQASVFGGNARGETWEGIDYAIGSASLVRPGEDSPLSAAFYDPLGLAGRWRAAPPAGIIAGDKLAGELWDEAGLSIPLAKTQVRKLRDYLRHVLEADYPEIPPADEPGDALKQRDMKTLVSELEGAVGDALAPELRAVLDRYCWGAFGAGAGEVSAAAGLNVLAGELRGVCALPGGNAAVASALLRAAAAETPAENFRVGTVVRRVVLSGDDVLVAARQADGTETVIKAKAVVVACPKFIARRIVEGLPQDQLDAMAALDYRAFLVANVLLDKPLPLDRYELLLTGGGPKALASELVVGHWAQGGAAAKAVLTLYRGMPVDGARGKLSQSGAFTRYRDEFVGQLPGILKALGAEPRVQPAQVRVTRWGHPVVLAAPGLIATGTVQRAATPAGGRIFFCNQDDWALPAIETCLTSALRVARQIKAVVA